MLFNVPIELMARPSQGQEPAGGALGVTRYSFEYFEYIVLLVLSTTVDDCMQLSYGESATCHMDPTMRPAHYQGGSGVPTGLYASTAY